MALSAFAAAWLFIGAVVPPRPLGEVRIVAPADAPTLSAPSEVTVALHIDATGKVENVSYVSGARGALLEAVLVGAVDFVFAPATDDGKPITSVIQFSQSFVPQAPTKSATLRGCAIEKGTRKAIVGASIVARLHDRVETTWSDAEGCFVLALSPGTYEVTLHGPAHRPFRVHEELQAQSALTVRYFVNPLSARRYESVIVADRDRTEVSRVSLMGREIAQVPGTFGDPFRVVTTLPGVGQINSLLGYAIVRGTSPGDTGYFLDAVSVPQLFHVLAGPSVIHPEFIDRVDFYPGNFPTRYGGFVGGIIEGLTKRAPSDTWHIDIDLDLLQSGVLARVPLKKNLTATVAARAGYPGYLLKAFEADLDVQYYDYQARLDGGLLNGRYKLFVFGSYDLLAVTDGVHFVQQFHRVDMSYRHEASTVEGDYALTFGYDETSSSPGDVGTLGTYSVSTRLRSAWHMTGTLTLNSGVDAGLQLFHGELAGETDQDGATLTTPGSISTRLFNAGAFTEIVANVFDSRLTLTPGARVDYYYNVPGVVLGSLPLGDLNTQGANLVSFDPRLGVRFRLYRYAKSDAYLKAGIGRFHQPARPSIPVPGLSQLSLSSTLLASWQSSIGALIPLSEFFNVDAQIYYNDLDPLLDDLNAGQSGTTGIDEFLSGLSGETRGRSYGLEILLRKRDAGALFGWLSYTLSRSERLSDNTYVPFDYDRTHMLQLVAGVSLPRAWHIGGQLMLQSGRPAASDAVPDARTPWFCRVDMRIDKRAVWRAWQLDFYVELLNVAVAAEPLSGSGQNTDSVAYILPTVGFRGVL